MTMLSMLVNMLLLKQGVMALVWAGTKQPVYWFLGGKVLGIQQGTSVWVGAPKSTRVLVGVECLQGICWVA